MRHRPTSARFKARGGKILMWHGLSDAAILATSSIGYYQGVQKLMGGRAATQDFFRLFLVPGVHHCAGGPGLTDFDALTLLENWVEKGEAPDVMIASRKVNGVTERTRPIYPYPVLARYSGQGDPKQASSFVPYRTEALNLKQSLSRLRAGGHRLDAARARPALAGYSARREYRTWSHSLSDPAADDRDSGHAIASAVCRTARLCTNSSYPAGL